MEDIILLGLGGHAHSVVDSIEQAGEYNIIGFFDTEEMQGKQYKDYRVLDTDDVLHTYFDKGIKNAFVCGASPQRRYFFFLCLNLILKVWLS